MRIGLGYDAHPLVTGKKLVLGGVEIPHEAGLQGHSDADVLLHAVSDALLGAAALGDIGQHFPDTDPLLKGVSSLWILEKTREMVEERGYRIGNVDAVIMAQSPRISSFYTEMRTRVAAVLNIPLKDISIKATTTEKMGFVGRKEGIAAQAVVILKKNIENK